jgi:DnaJ homolog subfamily C member 28
MIRRVEEAILKALETGAFDNLPGQGKPLVMDRNPHAGDMELAYKILKDHGFSLPWIEERNDIQKDLDGARVALRRTWAWYNGSEPAERAWRRAKAVFTEAVVQLNDRILTYNLKAPNESVHLRLIDAEKELRAVQEAGGE